MSLLKTNEIQVFNGTTVTITATTAEVSADLNVGADLDVTGALTLGTALAVAEGGTGATDAATARINLDVDQAGTDNSTDVSLVTTSHDYLSIAGQAITLGPIDLAADVTGTLATSNGGTGVTSLGSLDAADLGSGAATDGYVLTADGAGNAAWEAASGAILPIDLLSSGASIRKSDGTTAVLSESGGTVTLENTSLGDTVLMPDNSNNVSTAPGIRFEADTDTGIGLASAGNLAIVTGGSERVRVDSSGNLLVGKASASISAAGHDFFPNGTVYHVKDGGTSLYLNRLTSDGSIAEFRKDGTAVGSISSSGSAIIFNATTNGYLGINGTAEYIWSSTVFRPNGDDVASLGAAGDRWSVVYAATGLINTSDRNEKQDIAELNEAERRVAIACKGLLRKFRWKDAVAKKGDAARIHFGIIAQDLQAAFEAEGLDAGRYGMFIDSTWWETYTDVPAVEAKDAVLDNVGNVIEEAVEAAEAYTRTDTHDEPVEGAIEKSRMGVRYSELLAFIIAAI